MKIPETECKNGFAQDVIAATEFLLPIRTDEIIEYILIITDSGEAPAPALRQIRPNVQV